MTRRFVWMLVAGLAAATYAATARATPSSGFTATTLAAARFHSINVENFTLPVKFWQATLKSEGLSDVYVQSNVWVPGGTSGWHTHPSHSLILVTGGVITAYAADDPKCAPRVYSAGMGFVDEGGTHVHLLRNEGVVDASTIAVQLIPAAATRRIDAPAAAHCRF